MPQKLSTNPKAVKARERRHADPEKARAKGNAWRKKNPEKKAAAAARYYAKNQMELCMYSLLYHWANQEAENAKCRAAYAKNPACNIARAKQWKKDHPEQARETRNKNSRKRYAEDPAFKIERIVRGRIAKVVRLSKTGKVGLTAELLGCSIGRLMDYVTAHFQPGMDWTNMGDGPGKWSLDHKIPINEYDLLIPEQQKAAFSYLNLQPLWHQENLEKNDTYPWPRQSEIDRSVKAYNIPYLLAKAGGANTKFA